MNFFMTALLFARLQRRWTLFGPSLSQAFAEAVAKWSQSFAAARRSFMFNGPGLACLPEQF
jgi:hypothetical protein